MFTHTHTHTHTFTHTHTHTHRSCFYLCIFLSRHLSIQQSLNTCLYNHGWVDGLCVGNELTQHAHAQLRQRLDPARTLATLVQRRVPSARSPCRHRTLHHRRWPCRPAPPRPSTAAPVSVVVHRARQCFMRDARRALPASNGAQCLRLPRPRCLSPLSPPPRPPPLALARVRALCRYI